MGFDPVSFAASSAGDLVGGAVSNYYNKKATQRGYAYSRKLRQTAYQDTMSDLRTAGLNPILASKVGGSSATSVPSSSTPIANLGKNTVSSALDGALKKEQIALLEAQENKVAVEQHGQELQNSADSMRNEIMAAYLEGEKNKGKIYSEEPSKKLQEVERLLDPLGKILGGANSARDLFKTRK